MSGLSPNSSDPFDGGEYVFCSRDTRVGQIPDTYLYCSRYRRSTHTLHLLYNARPPNGTSEHVSRVSSGRRGQQLRCTLYVRTTWTRIHRTLKRIAYASDRGAPGRCAAPRSRIWFHLARACAPPAAVLSLLGRRCLVRDVFFSPLVCTRAARVVVQQSCSCIVA